jgi:hypothetical protein
MNVSSGVYQTIKQAVVQICFSKSIRTCLSMSLSHPTALTAWADTF